MSILISERCTIYVDRQPATTVDQIERALCLVPGGIEHASVLVDPECQRDGQLPQVFIALKRAGVPESRVHVGIVPPPPSGAGAVDGMIATGESGFDMSSAQPSAPMLIRKGFRCAAPAKARAAGRYAGIARLRIDVSADGRATRAEAASAGDDKDGFVAAARACVLKAKFTPAHDDAGKAVAGVATMTVRFEDE